MGSVRITCADIVLCRNQISFSQGRVYPLDNVKFFDSRRDVLGRCVMGGGKGRSRCGRGVEQVCALGGCMVRRERCGARGRGDINTCLTGVWRGVHTLYIALAGLQLVPRCLTGVWRGVHTLNAALAGLQLVPRCLTG
eukprot:138154-Chlamydomonas_euryale.AAC.1